MKKGHVLIASCNSRYNQKTAETITSRLSNVSCDALEISESRILVKKSDCSEIVADKTNVYDICFCHSYVLLQPESGLRTNEKDDVQEMKLKGCELTFCVRYFITFGNQDQRGSFENQNELAWPAPLSQLIFQIELLLSDLPEPCSKVNSSARTSEEPLASGQHRDLSCSPNDSDRKIRLGLHLRIGSDGSSWLLKQINSSIDEGKQVYYLPLMPVYQMKMVSDPDKCGSNLSDLLLAIHQNCPPKINSIGSYTQMHPRGYLQFRPPDRADDILCCEPEDLRQLIVLLRQKTESLPDRCSAWIDCQGLPLSTVARLTVLCDCLSVCIPHTEDYAARTARRELGLLMAKLPASCAIREIEGDVCHDA